MQIITGLEKKKEQWTHRINCAHCYSTLLLDFYDVVVAYDANDKCIISFNCGACRLDNKITTTYNLPLLEWTYIDTALERMKSFKIKVNAGPYR